jgi:hypothetical protein
MKNILTAAALAAAISSSAADAALIALYKFDNAANLGLDSSGLGNHAVNSGAQHTALGFQGGAASFAGNQWLTASVNTSVSALPAMTWGAWVKPAVGGAGIQPVLSNDNGGFDRQIGIDSRGGVNAWSTFKGNTGGGVLSSGVAPSTTEWTFVAAAYEANKVTFYVNGQSVSSGTAFGPSVDSFAIGRNPTFVSFFSGQIDNVFVYNTTLSAAEIAEIRATGFPNKPVSAVPEPATWAMMLAGFGLAGAGLRRRRIATTVLA